MCRPMPTYVFFKNIQLTLNVAKRPLCFPKSSVCFLKSSLCFQKTSAPFKKAGYVFYAVAGGIIPSLSRSSFFSLHPYILIKLHFYQTVKNDNTSPHPPFGRAFHVLSQSAFSNSHSVTHLLSLPFSVGADPCVCPGTVHFKLSGVCLN